jgi:hypothetical protein
MNISFEDAKTHSIGDDGMSLAEGKRRVCIAGRMRECPDVTNDEFVNETPLLLLLLLFTLLLR